MPEYFISTSRTEMEVSEIRRRGMLITGAGVGGGVGASRGKKFERDSAAGCAAPLGFDGMVLEVDGESKDGTWSQL